IARIYDSGLHQGRYYYAMELIDGMPLDLYVRSKALSRNEILALMRTVCHAVLFAHQRAVIHRDIKPSNILVSPDGQPHVLDFGLAKGLLEDEDALTISIEGQIAGTPAYMSPEQATGHHSQLDTRTDVFSLGVILYELLTGQTPHGQSGSMFDLLQKIVEGKIRRPSQIDKSIDTELEAILLKTLAQNPEDRYASAGALAKDIDNYLDEEPLDARVPTTLYFLRKKVRKYRVQVAAVAAILLLIFGAIVIAYTKGVQTRTLREAVDRALDFNDLSWSDLQMEVSGGDPKDTLAALSVLRDRYVAAQEEIGQLNHQLGEQKSPVAVRRIDLRSGPPMASTALVREPSLPGGITSWTLETYGHRGRITTLVFSPNGSRLASAGLDGTIRIWDSESGQPQHVLADPNAHVSDLAWSADGRNLKGIAAADPNRRSVWDIESGRIRAAGGGPAGINWHDSSDTCWSAGPQGPAQMLDQVARSRGIPLSSAWFSKSKSITALALSPERQQVACGAEDGTIWILDTASAQVAHTQAGAWCGPAKSVSFSPDRKTLATYSAAGTLCLWQADRWGPVRSYETERVRTTVSATGAITWAPDSRHIARADNSGTIIEILALSSGEVVRSLSVND
ncbi:MAG: protein kinase, partial [Phycisphaerales bacterium]